MYSKKTVAVIGGTGKYLLKKIVTQDLRVKAFVRRLNVDTPYDEKSQNTRFATAWMYEHFPISTKYRQLEYDMLIESDADWTLVRLPMIEQTDHSNEIVVNLKESPSEKISAAPLTEFLMLQIEDTSFIGKATFIGNK
jgi:hypothetical protein